MPWLRGWLGEASNHYTATMESKDSETTDSVGEQPSDDAANTSEHVAPSEAPEVTDDVATIDLTENPTGDGPTVDALESQLRDLQGAMDQLQSGDLDAAERTIEALEQSVGSTRD